MTACLSDRKPRPEYRGRPGDSVNCNKVASELRDVGVLAGAASAMAERRAV